MTIPRHGQGTGCCWEYFKAATLATRQVPGCTSGCVSRVFCAMCFFPIFLWKWRNGHVVNPIINNPQHHHFSGLKSSPVMVGLCHWVNPALCSETRWPPKTRFLLPCAVKKTRCWPSLSSTVGADESNWAHANGIALVRLVVTPIPS